MKELWFSRDLPVLIAVVEYFEEHDRPLLNLSTLSEITGIAVKDVGKAARNLDGAGFLDLTILMTGEDCAPWFISRVHSSALYAAGAWPTPESVSALIIDEIEKYADSQKADGDKGWVKRIMSGAGEISKDVFTRVVTEVVLGALALK